MKAAKGRPRSTVQADVDFGQRIRLRRIEMELSQADLGARLGVSFQQIQKYEKGVNRVGAARLQKIADALGVPVTFFYNENKHQGEVESLLFLDAPFMMRLLRAYSRVADVKVQRSFVSLIESIAEP